MNAIFSQLHDDVVVHTKLVDVDKAYICEKLAQVIIILFIILYYKF
jgi:hypothetical protein